VYGQEADCAGGLSLGDDPNLPSLMALPLYNFTMRLDPIWLNTKRYLYSTSNPLYYSSQSN
jgi:meiotically up-regulated gene 157 (Mug157) protein